MAEVNYAGVALSFAGPTGLLECMARVAGAQEREVAPAARVVCQLHESSEPDPVLATARERGWLHWEWQSGTAQVVTRSARARLWRAGAAYAAEAWLSPHSRAATTLVGALSSAVLHDVGGILLHAASILGESGVVAFVGPSGAGKSTACGHMGGAPIFSIDRMVIVPSHPGTTNPERPVGNRPTWFACPLFGGTVLHPEAPRALPDWSPLRAIFRVHQAPRGAHVEECTGSRALASLRESAFTGGSDPGAELELLARLERLRADVPVGRLHFGLGSCLPPVVSRWLSGQSC
jgi:hypothetical protein